MARKSISRYIDRRRERRRIDFDDSLINNRIGLKRSFCSIQEIISRMTLNSRRQNKKKLVKFEIVFSMGLCEENQVFFSLLSSEKSRLPDFK